MQLSCDITQLHDPDAGEPPLFECTMMNGATGAVLAAGVRGSSKKLVRNAAANVAIKRLWTLKTDAGTLLEEDKAYLAKLEQAQRDGVPDVESDGENYPPPPPPSSETLPVKISAYERSLDKVMLLNQLHQQERLDVHFEFEDLLPHSKGSHEFQCVVRINGETLGVSTAPNKKTARTDAAKLAFAAALEKKIVFYWDAPEDSA